MCVYNISDIICNLKQVHQWTCENIPRSFITLKLNQYHRKLEQQSFDVLACSTKSIKRFIYTRLKIFLHIVNHFDQISNFQPCEFYDRQTLFSKHMNYAKWDLHVKFECVQVCWYICGYRNEKWSCEEWIKSLISIKLLQVYKRFVLQFFVNSYYCIVTCMLTRC